MSLVSHKTFTTGAEIYANAKAVRERMMKPAKFNNKGTDELKQAIADLEATIADQQLIIDAYALNQADFEASMMCQAHMIVDLLRQLGGEPDVEVRQSPRKIIEDVLAKSFPLVTFAQVIGPQRRRELVAARHACMAAVYEQRSDLSFPQIGKIFNRDHTVILYACNRLTNRQKKGSK